MKNRAIAALLIISALGGFALGGCSLFHHEKKPKPWHPKPLGPMGPMEGDPVPMEAQPREPQPLPIEPEPAVSQ